MKKGKRNFVWADQTRVVGIAFRTKPTIEVLNRATHCAQRHIYSLRSFLWWLKLIVVVATSAAYSLVSLSMSIFFISRFDIASNSFEMTHKLNVCISRCCRRKGHRIRFRIRVVRQLWKCSWEHFCLISGRGQTIFNANSNLIHARLYYASSQMLKYVHQNDELILLSVMRFGQRKSLDVEENWIFHYESSVGWTTSDRRRNRLLDKMGDMKTKNWCVSNFFKSSLDAVPCFFEIIVLVIPPMLHLCESVSMCCNDCLLRLYCCITFVTLWIRCLTRLMTENSHPNFIRYLVTFYSNANRTYVRRNAYLMKAMHMNRKLNDFDTAHTR